MQFTRAKTRNSIRVFTLGGDDKYRTRHYSARRRKCNINNSCGEFERLRTLTTSLGNTHLAHLLIVFAIWPRTLSSWSCFISHSLQNFILQRFWRETWISFRWVSNFHKSQTVERLLLRLLWKPLSIIPSAGEKTTSSQVLSSSIICINTTV